MLLLVVASGAAAGGVTLLEASEHGGLVLVHTKVAV